MGKGGPLAFLNKKPWHPGNIQNQEEIWKREQAFLAEVEKREELKRQIEDEREAEDNVTQFQREKCAVDFICGGFKSPMRVLHHVTVWLRFLMALVFTGLGTSVWSGCTKVGLRQEKTQRRRRKSILWARRWTSYQTMAQKRQHPG